MPQKKVPSQTAKIIDFPVISKKKSSKPMTPIKSKTIVSPGIARFKIYLQGNKKAYRVIDISLKQTLYQLAFFIIKSINFDFDHLFGFFNNLSNWNKSTEIYELAIENDSLEAGENVEKTPIHLAFTDIGKEMLFLFDFGDEWKFIVKLIDIVEKENAHTYPYIVESKGKFPEQYPDNDD